MSKPGKKAADEGAALQWARTLRDLVELRNQTLDRVKGHLLGRNETGAITEPENAWDKNPQVMFERYFKRQLSPWTEQDLELECEDCGLSSDEVVNRHFPGKYENYVEAKSSEDIDLCPNCYTKRQGKEAEAGVEANDSHGQGYATGPQ
ncbi:MAG: hypothetical protein WCC94_04925 [Candidatus Bathyarchaeia archaeon]